MTTTRRVPIGLLQRLALAVHGTPAGDELDRLLAAAPAEEAAPAPDKLCEQAAELNSHPMWIEACLYLAKALRDPALVPIEHALLRKAVKADGNAPLEQTAICCALDIDALKGTPPSQTEGITSPPSSD